MKILYFTNTFSHYRLPIWKKLLALNNHEIFFHFSFESFKGIISANLESKFFINIKNVKLFGRIFWQRGVLNKVLFNNYDTLLLLGEMTILSNWLASIIARIKNKKVIFWGHGIYGNEKGLKRILRLIFLKLSNYHFLYGNHAKKLLINEGFKSENLLVIYNSLDVEIQNQYYLEEKVDIKFNFLKTDKYILFTGRLTKIKDLDLLFESLEIINKKKNLLSFVIVGEGNEKAWLQRKYSHLIKRGLVHFEGDIYDESKLSEYFKNAYLFVSPGNIGLACMHSLIYGTPVCTHGNMNYQMPEAECLNEYNSVVFKRGDVNSLTRAIKKGLLLKDFTETENKCRSTILKTYTPKNQIEIIETFLDSI